MQSKITAEQARSLQRNTRLARAKQRRGLRAGELEAPTVDGLLFSDNLVPIELLDAGLTVHIKAWPRVHANDELTIQWQGSNIHSFIVSDPATELPYQFLLTKEHLQLNGTYDLTYSVALDSGETGASLPTSITIDNTPPNLGNIPLELEFPPEVVTDGITLEYLSANEDKVVAKVPAYVNMEADQRVHLIWAVSHFVPVKPVVQADVDQGYVEVDIPGDIIRQAGEGSRDAHYYLTSRAGVDSELSLHSTLDVLLSPQPSGLQPPQVPLAADGLVDLAEATAGVTIEIPSYENIGPADQIAAKWGNAALPLYPMPQDGLPLDIPVPRKTVLDEGSGDISVSYQVVHNNHIYTAAPASITVDVDTAGPEDPDTSTPENESLAPPHVKGGGAGLDNELEGSDLHIAATVTVALYDNAQVGEIVTVYWGRPTRATALPAYTLTQADIDAGSIPDFSVDAAIVDATPNDPVWPVYYTISRPQGAGPSNPVLSPKQEVNVHMRGPGGVAGLQAATFPDINDRGWLLRPTVDPDGANIIVAAYEYMQIGDVVKLDWLAYKAPGTPAGEELAETAFSATVTIDPDNLNKDLLFNVPFDAYIHPIEVENPTDMQGSATVNYIVTQGGLPFAGKEATVNIELFQFR